MSGSGPYCPCCYRASVEARRNPDFDIFEHIQKCAARLRKAVKPQRAKPRRGRLRDREYLRWIKTQPCVICHQLGVSAMTGLRATEHYQLSPTEAAHVGVRGMSQKCSDYETMPLCGLEHHREGARSIHKLGRNNFEFFHGIDIPELIRVLNHKFEQEKVNG